MRAVAVSVWIFINLVFVGMCGYIYLLWSQYWRYVERQNGQMSTNFNPNRNYNGYSSGSGSGNSATGQIYYYYHGSSSEALASGISGYGGNPYQHRGLRNNRTVPKHHLRERGGHRPVTMIRRHNSPRFPRLKNSDPSERCEGDSAECGVGASAIEPLVDDKLASKVSTYKGQLVVQLRRVLLDEGSVFRARGDAANPYGVRYAGPRGSYQGRSARELICELHQAAAGVRPLRPSDEPFRRLGLGLRFPAAPLLGADGRRYNACAVVSNAGALHGSRLGRFIDKHDLVLRFNHAPTENYEEDVGSKTTIRILNSQVVSKPEFDFLNSPLYEGVSLLVWDPSNYSATLEEWYDNPDFDLFTPYFRHRELYPEQVFHMLDPRSLWALWEFIQSHIPVRIRKNPPSSGFLGLALLLPHCAYVDIFEYVPSMRLTKRCHYWEVTEDLSCTFGVWHPLAAEKLLALALNVASDPAVYASGYIRVPGYEALKC